MSVSISDTGRLLSLTTALGAGERALYPVGFQAQEAISAPFGVEVDAVSSDPAIDANRLLFKPACLTVTQVSQPRHFNGMVRAVTASGVPVRGMYRYTLSIVPKLWFLGQTLDCRIFQQKTAGDIVTTLCGEIGQTLQTKLFSDLPSLDYVTQYNETGLQFVSRLLEQAGLFYFFEHTASDHTLIVTNANQAFPATPKPVLAVIHEGNNIDTLSDWRQRSATTFGSVNLQDYDLTQTTSGNIPQATIATTFTQAAGIAGRKAMQWPALSVDNAVVSDRTRFAMEAAEAEVSLTQTASTNHTLAPGGCFTLLRNPFTGAESVDYVVRAVSHQGTDESWVAAGAQPSYANQASVFPAAVTWRQKLAVPRPQMAGIFAAIVLGDAGDEIHTEQYGRIKVRLMWDHRNDTTADQGVWVRVIQPWAGNTWGWQHLPRVGSEVAVAFMDGDPDRPVVVGGLYNANMMPVFPLPGQANKSGLRSRSTKTGGSANFSEFSIDDTIGSELFYVHAEKDMTREVENDDKLTVSNTQTITVAKGRAATIHDGGDKLTVTAGGRTATVQDGGDKLTVNTGGRTATIAAGGDSLTVQSGDLSMQVSTGAVSIEALQSITLKVGGNTLTVDQSGISLKGIMVQIEGQAMVQVKGPMIQVNADGVLILKGGIVMVN
jgi:type VI secretion system secreted protein VgrG